MPLPEPSPLTLASVNRLSRAEFTAALGGVFDEPLANQHFTPLRRVDPLGRPGARAATRGMSLPILSSQRQSENSDTLLLVLPTAQEH
jgi:hypothetical protein